jgi:purine-nucleoside phosphorylase
VHDKSLEHYRNGTPHNAAKAGDIAPTVLMPGDPLRAKFIAETRLEGAKQVNAVRNMFAYTGSYRGKPVSVMGSGMGAPSMGIYSYELFAFYDVERVIRIGTCGGLTAAVEVGDIVFAMTSSTDTNYASQYRLNGSFSPCADYGLLEAAVRVAREKSARYWVGGVLSSDVFSLYSALPPEDGWQRWARMGCAATDMESYALYCNAAYHGKKALAMFTCSDSNISRREMSPEERQTALSTMFDIALEIA